MKKFLIVLISLLAPCQIILASEYIGEYKCKPTFVLREDLLFIINGKDDIQVMLINPNPETELGLVDENLLKKIEMTPEDFLKFKSEIFKQHSFRMKISENAGQITQPGKNQDVDVYFEHVLVNNGMETDPKILMGYTEFGNKESKDEFWHIRDYVFSDVFKDTSKYLDKSYGTRDVDIYYFSDADGKTSADPIIRNMLRNLAYSGFFGSWIKISLSDSSGTLNFSVDNAGELLNYNVRETDKFRAICKLI